MKPVRHIAVVGGGWAGCAAALELTRRGERVSLFEQARVLGGRARAVELHGQRLDNGQHILLGAYSATLELMKYAGIDRRDAFIELPLQMRYPPGSEGMDFVVPRLPAPLHLLGGLLWAKGLGSSDKLALARFSTAMRWMGWTLYQDCSVLELMQRFDQTERLYRLMWRPLCIAALNTPPERASAIIFLNVLRDSLGARRHASDMLLPRIDLSALFPQRAAETVIHGGGDVFLGHTVDAVAPDNGGWTLRTRQAETAFRFDSVILALPAEQAAHMLSTLTGTNTLPAFDYEPITTCYLQYDPALVLALPFYTLLDEPALGRHGQFVFDRGRLDAHQAGLLAVVISASRDAIEMGATELAQAVARQLATDLQMSTLANPAWTKVITEKRATFACTPGLQRPGPETGLRGLYLAGDYLKSDYPATLESAVRSGVMAAELAAGSAT